MPVVAAPQNAPGAGGSPAGASLPPNPPRPPRHDVIAAVERFWHRVSEGLAVEELWAQFRKEARSSYRLYSRDVQPYEPEGAREHQKLHQWWHTARQFFWAVMMKLSPPRRVLLIIALAMLLLGQFVVKDDRGNDRVNIELRGLGAAVILLVLVLEVSDRVTMKRDLEIAREIQTWLSPAGAPQLAEAEIAFTTRPANTVAGDYHDAFWRMVPEDSGGGRDASRRLVLIVADVAGKSIPAAMLMATLHASLHTLAHTARDVGELVAGLDAYCCEHSNEGRRFTTAFVAEFDPATRRLWSINAGHNAPVLLRASGAIERLDTGGVPLGISTALVYGVAEHALAPGDVLFIFTDGLVEAENAAQEEFGEDRLLPLLIQYRALPAVEMMARVMESVERFVGDTPQHDDVTGMVVRVR